MSEILELFLNNVDLKSESIRELLNLAWYEKDNYSIKDHIYFLQERYTKNQLLNLIFGVLEYKKNYALIKKIKKILKKLK